MRNLTTALYLILSATAVHGMCGPEKPNIPLTYVYSVLSAVATQPLVVEERGCDLLPNVIKASQLVPAYPIKPLDECTTPEECLCMYYPKKRYWKNLIRYLNAHEQDIIFPRSDEGKLILFPYCTQTVLAGIVTTLTRDKNLTPCSEEQATFLEAMRFGTYLKTAGDPLYEGKSALAIAYTQIEQLCRNRATAKKEEASFITAFGQNVGGQLAQEEKRIIETFTATQQLILAHMALQSPHTQHE